MTQPGITPRSRWVPAAIGAGLLALVVVGFLVVDVVATQLARDGVRARIIEVLGLGSDAEVDVEFGGGPLVLQALTGRIGSVAVEIPDAAIGPLVGAVAVRADGVPLDPMEPVENLEVRVTVAADDLLELANALSGLEVDSLELDEPDILVDPHVSIFGVRLDVTLALTPEADDGRLALTPSRVRVAGTDVPIPELAENPLFSGIASQLLGAQTVCIADELPQALVLVDAAVEGSTLVLGFDADGAALGGAEFATPGSCD